MDSADRKKDDCPLHVSAYVAADILAYLQPRSLRNETPLEYAMPRLPNPDRGMGTALSETERRQEAGEEVAGRAINIFHSVLR